MRLGDLSAQTDCKTETIRYYEKIGLLPEPARSASGYRDYGDDHLKRLSFIRRCRELGFKIDEIRGLLELVDDGDYTCSDVKKITLEVVYQPSTYVTQFK